MECVSKCLFAVFILNFANVAEMADPRCASALEEWSECSAHCQPTCAQPGPDIPCTRNCLPGCVCQPGMVRTASRDCIRPEQCNKDSMTCPGPNEVFDRCGANGCQNTCQKPSKSASCDSLGCSIGCICQSGYVRNGDNICTLAESCVKCDDKHARWDNAGATGCQNTCREPERSTYCRPSGPEAGCVCVDGYLKNTTSDRCEPAESCGYCSDPNARYSLTEAHACQSTCANPDLASRCRPDGPRKGCVCKENFLRREAKGCCVLACHCRRKKI